MPRDVFIPLLTHPVPDGRETALSLLRLAAAFSTEASLSPLEVTAPSLRHRWAGALPELLGAGSAIERNSRQAVDDLGDIPAELDGLSVSVRPIQIVLGDFGDNVVRMARHHDLAMVVFGEAPDLRTGLAETLIFGSGRPTLLVPGSIAASQRPFGCIAVCWDGSRAASRAVHDAMPFLVEADKVVVLNAPADKAIDAIEYMGFVEHLGRHGIEATRVEVGIEVQDIALALQHAALAQRADLMVMGAYGHSRLQQFILGGATRGVLTNPKLPVLLSH